MIESGKRRRTMKKNILSIMLAAAMTGTLLAGCGSGSGGSVAQKADKDSITVLVESG